MKQLSFIKADGTLPSDKYRFVKIPDDEYEELKARSECGQEAPAIVSVNGDAIYFSVNDLVETPFGMTATIIRIVRECT